MNELEKLQAWLNGSEKQANEAISEAVFSKFTNLPACQSAVRLATMRCEAMKAVAYICVSNLGINHPITINVLLLDKRPTSAKNSRQLYVASGLRD